MSSCKPYKSLCIYPVMLEKKQKIMLQKLPNGHLASQKKQDMLIRKRKYF